MNTAQPIGGKTVLVVEDNEITRAGVAILLRQAGYSVDVARDGQQALNYLSNHRPDLILLDMLLPVLDGWHFLKELQSWSQPPNIPIVITTGTCLSREWAQEHGCAGFVRKPIELDALLAEIKRCQG